MEKCLGEYYSADELIDLEVILRQPPIYTTIHVNTLKCDKKEAILMLKNHFMSRNEFFNVEEHNDFSDVLMIKAIGPAKVEPSVKEIIVDCSCGAALLRGADLYVAGIIGMEECILSDNKVSIWADLDGSCKKGLKKKYYGRKEFIGNGICQLDRFSVFSNKNLNSCIGVKMTEMLYKMPSLNGVFSEFIFPQNIPSIAVSRALSPSLNSRVLDMCGSPGGKTCHLAALMKNTGQILSIDRISKKTDKIRENCNLLGVTNVKVLTADSTKLLENKIFEPESFDFILLDPPCSGLGLRPKIKLSSAEWDNVENFAPYQRKLFNQAWSLLKPGGELIFSTCTINPLENELLVDKMLNYLVDAELLPIREGILEKYCLPGLQVGSLSDETCRRCICRFWPSSERDYNGFFIAKFKKRLKDTAN